MKLGKKKTLTQRFAAFRVAVICPKKNRIGTWFVERKTIGRSIKADAKRPPTWPLANQSPPIDRNCDVFFFTSKEGGGPRKREKNGDTHTQTHAYTLTHTHTPKARAGREKQNTLERRRSRPPTEHDGRGVAAGRRRQRAPPARTGVGFNDGELDDGTVRSPYDTRPPTRPPPSSSGISNGRPTGERQ